jgi:TonB-like protein
MDRADATGFGVATAGHLALLAALSLGLAGTRLPAPRNDPIEVSFVEEVGLESTAPTRSAAEPAPRLASEAGPPEPAMPAPPDVQPVPVPETKPAVRSAEPKPSPAPKPAVSRPTGRLSGLLTGVSDRDSDSRSAAAPAAAAGPAVQASLAAEVRRQVKPHWKAPTGADAEQLRTELVISLAANGQVTDISIVGTSGQTASNRPQVKLHQEQAARAVRLAAPFRLPAQYYEAWKSLRITFDKRLSQ